MQNVKVSIPDKIDVITTPNPESQSENRNPSTENPASQNYSGSLTSIALKPKQNSFANELDPMETNRKRDHYLGCIHGVLS
jgi:hypothetical protein